MDRMFFYIFFISLYCVNSQAMNNTLDIAFIKVAAGCFSMGQNNSHLDLNNNQLPAHKVCIKRPFYLSKTEISQTQWLKIMDYNPSVFKHPDHPVENISWHTVQQFIARLQEKEKESHYRLPTEAEWEYAARAGSKTAYHFAHSSATLSEYAWVGNLSKSHPVGQKKPNAWGLHDMHGNVWEWVNDWYASDYYQTTLSDDPGGPDTGDYRVIRGGGWNSSAINSRSATRYFNPANARYNFIGFRLVKSIEVIDER